MLRLDRMENYEELINQIGALGIYAHPELQQVVDEYATEADGRDKIRRTANVLLGQM